MKSNLAQLTDAVQRNCDISDARHAGDYGLCTFLLKMREYYRWENELPFSHPLPRTDLGKLLRFSGAPGLPPRLPSDRPVS